MPNTPAQERRTGQVEAALRLGAPFLDLLLTVGDRVSRIVAPERDDYYAIRPSGDRLELDHIRATSPAAPARHPEA
jgi:hypothetical protein